MKKETIEEFLARGGKVSKSGAKDVSLEDLLKKEGLMTEDGAKAIAELISSSISEKVEAEVKKSED